MACAASSPTTATLTSTTSFFQLEKDDYLSCRLKNHQHLKEPAQTVYDFSQKPESLKTYKTNLSLVSCDEESASCTTGDLYLPSEVALYLLLKDLVEKNLIKRTDAVYISLRSAFIGSIFRKTLKIHFLPPFENKAKYEELSNFSIKWIDLMIRTTAKKTSSSFSIPWGHLEHFSMAEICHEEGETLQVNLFDPHLPASTLTGKPLSSRMTCVIETQDSLNLASAIVKSWSEDSAFYISQIMALGFTSEESVDKKHSKLNCTLAAPLEWLRSQYTDSYVELIKA